MNQQEEQDNHRNHVNNDSSNGSGNSDYQNINELRKSLVTEQQLSSSKVELKEIEDPINAVENSGNKIKNRDYVDFVLQCAKKKVKLDDILVKQILYFGLSTYMNDPTNLAVLASTSTGKTHAVTSILEYFPQEDVRFIGKMSPMALVREQGILVDSNGEPIKGRLKQLRHDIDKAQSEKNLELIKELEDQLDKVKSEARTQINLNNKILVFLEPPNIELWNGLKPVLSHDRPEIEFPFTNRTEKLGIETKKVFVRGAPVCIFCSAKDESKSEWWEEIENRFFITSPNTNEEKFYLANELTANRKGLPRQLKKRLLVQTSDEILTKKCVAYIKQQILKLSKSHLKPNEVGNDLEDSVWIPYKDELVKFLPSKEGVDMRSAKKIFSLIETVTLANAHLRKKLNLQIEGAREEEEAVENEELTPIASLQDLYEVMQLVKDASTIPANKSEFFWNYFVPCFKAKDEKADKDEKKGIEEKIVGVTSKQLAEYFRNKKGLKSYGSENIRKTFLEYLMRVGYIDKVESEIDKRSDIFYPIIDIEKGDKSGSSKNKSTTDQNNDFVNLNSSSSSFSSGLLMQQQQQLASSNHNSVIDHNPNWCLSSKIRKLRNHDSFCNILQESKIVISKNFDNIPTNWLELQIMAFFNYRIQIRLLSILNEEGNQEISIFRFIDEYLNFNPNQIRYYKKSTFSKYYNKVFGSPKYLGMQYDTTYEKLRNDTKFDNFFIIRNDFRGVGNSTSYLDNNYHQPKLPSPKQIPMLPHNDIKGVETIETEQRQSYGTKLTPLSKLDEGRMLQRQQDQPRRQYPSR